MRKLVVIICMCLLAHVSFAQKDYRAGYVVKAPQDTVYGWIDYKGSMSNAVKCNFKSSLSQEEPTVYSPEDIVGYKFKDGKFYMAKFPQGDLKKSVFLEFLINGIVDVFYYRDKEGEHYFVQTEEGNLYALKNDVTEFYRNDVAYLRSSEEYKGLLRYVFRDNPQIQHKVNTLKLDHKSLINIAHDYHEAVCEDESCIIYEKRLPQIKVKFGPQLSWHAFRPVVNGDFAKEEYFFEDNDFGWSQYPSIGFFVKVNAPNVNERIFLQYEVNYGKRNMHTTNKYHDRIYNLNYINKIDWEQQVLSANLLVRYEYPRGNWRPVFQGGLFYDWFVTSDLHRKTDVYYEWGDLYDTRLSDENPTNNNDLGIIVGSGFIKKLNSGREIMVDLRYSMGVGIYENFKSHNISLQVGIQLNK